MAPQVKEYIKNINTDNMLIIKIYLIIREKSKDFLYKLKRNEMKILYIFENNKRSTLKPTHNKTTG